MEGRELRRCYTQLDFPTASQTHTHHQQGGGVRARQQNGSVGGVASLSPARHVRNKTPSIEIYRPPGQRSDVDGVGGRQLNVHAKEFVMSPANTLQTSRSTGNIVLHQGASVMQSSVHHQIADLSASHHSILLSSTIKHSPSNKNVRWEDGKSRGGGGGGVGVGLVRSKSMVSPQRRSSEGRTCCPPAVPALTDSSTKDSVITPLGPLSRTQYGNIKHAIDGTGKLSSEDTMGVVKVLIDRAIESRNYANVIATACDKIIHRESSVCSSGSMFLESLINYSQYSLNKLKENSVNRKFNGIMAFVCELYIMLKSKALVRDAKWGLVSPTQWLLKLLAKCCHEVLQDPHLHMKPDMVGEWYEVERSFYLVESALRCTRVNFTLSEDQSKLHVQVIYKLPWRSEVSSAEYEAEVGGSTTSSGVVELVLRDVPGYLARLAPGSGSYTVLDIDPHDYALIYSCTNFRFFHADFVWILGRSEDISARMRSRVYAGLDQLSIPRDRLLLTKHNCITAPSRSPTP